METSNLTKRRIQEFLDQDKRFDNRSLLQFRDIKIETGVSKNAEGSARIKMGNTEVIAGVKIDVTEPYTDREDEGTLITTCELLPLSSPKYEVGPPRINAIEIARIVDRGIRESGFIDFKKLCIKEGEKVWTVFVDVYPINHDGNLVDAGSLAVIVALKNTRIPSFDKDDKIDREKLTDPLPLKHTPITITIGKVQDKMLIDPTFEEEQVLDTKLCIAVTEEEKVVSMQKIGAGPLTDDEVDKMIDIAVEKSKELRKLVENGKENTKSKTKAD